MPVKPVEILGFKVIHQNGEKKKKSFPETKQCRIILKRQLWKPFYHKQTKTICVYLPMFSLGQEVCGEKPTGGFTLGATTATPATLVESFFNFIMMDLLAR